MGKIYLITNMINGKKYVGKTEATIEERFRQHIKDSKKLRCSNRPLYRAMNKYGVENFKLSLIEDTDEPEERETYWISKLNTYGKNGYNATLGGDSRKYLNYNKIIKTYKKHQNLKETANICHCSTDSVRKVLIANNIEIKNSSEILAEITSKKIVQYSLNNKKIKEYNSCTEAANAMGNPSWRRHISECANDRRKTAYGFLWRFA